MQDFEENHSGTVRNWPKSERPRERLLEKGAEALSTSELLAILIGHGERGVTALDLARQISGELTQLTPASLIRIRGLGPAKAARILAALELGRRALREDRNDSIRLVGSTAVAELIRPRIAGVTREIFFAISVDVKNRPLAIQEVARGGVEGVNMNPREIFSEIIRSGASGLLCVHNHPSGDPTPSQEDRFLTKRLKEGSQLLGIRFLDHVIVTTSRHFSFADEGN